ncbi:MAG: hypothetical protein QOG10_5479, partial [Kribbellaceae bacterium]|nr:hypothetical protein [Kribbellaceae bacterium]
MIWLGCGGGSWFECMVEAIGKVVGPVVAELIKTIFQPILDALFEAVGNLMATIGTFWVFVPTPGIGAGTSNSTNDAVGWIWGHTSYITVFAATISVIMAGVHMAWSQRGEAARDLLKSLMTLAVASALVISVVQVLIQVGDKFSTCIVVTAMNNQQNGWTCQLSDADPKNFGAAMLEMMGLVAVAGGPGGLGIGLLITIGIITVLASIIQIVLMVVRSAMLILLVGVLPMAAAATNTEMGRGWFKRIISWLVAFLLYKPVAALIYATAIMLTTPQGPLAYDHQGPPSDATVGTDVMNMVTGVTMLMLALFALPALMKFIAPMVAATAGAAGAGAIAGKLVGGGMEKIADKASESAKSESDGPTGAQNVGRPAPSSSQPSGSGGGGQSPAPQPTGGGGGA